MRYRKLGKTGIEVSEIGFGAWGIGGVSKGATSYGVTDDRESLVTLRRAFDLGITLYDTADAYGNGHSEELIGRAFNSVRDKVLLASKVGYVAYDKPKDFSPQRMKIALENSLRRLRTEYLDLYQLHSIGIDEIRRNEKIVATLESFQREGKIRAYGISVKTPDDGIIAIQTYGFQTVQVNFNMIDQRALISGLFNVAAASAVGIIVRTPLAFGFLSGAVLDLNFDSCDHRSRWSRAQLNVWAEAPRLFAKLNKKKKRTLSQLALQFCLAHNAISSVIPGMMHPYEVDENAAVADMDHLADSECAEIHTIYKSNTFFV